MNVVRPNDSTESVHWAPNVDRLVPLFDVYNRNLQAIAKQLVHNFISPKISLYTLLISDVATNMCL